MAGAGLAVAQRRLRPDSSYRRLSPRMAPGARSARAGARIWAGGCGKVRAHAMVSLALVLCTCFAVAGDLVQHPVLPVPVRGTGLVDNGAHPATRHLRRTQAEHGKRRGEGPKRSRGESERGSDRREVASARPLGDSGGSSVVETETRPELAARARSQQAKASPENAEAPLQVATDAGYSSSKDKVLACRWNPSLASRNLLSFWERNGTFGAWQTPAQVAKELIADRSILCTNLRPIIDLMPLSIQTAAHIHANPAEPSVVTVLSEVRIGRHSSSPWDEPDPCSITTMCSVGSPKVRCRCRSAPRCRPVPPPS